MNVLQIEVEIDTDMIGRRKTIDLSSCFEIITCAQNADRQTFASETFENREHKTPTYEQMPLTTEPHLMIKKLVWNCEIVLSQNTPFQV